MVLGDTIIKDFELLIFCLFGVHHLRRGLSVLKTTFLKMLSRICFKEPNRIVLLPPVEKICKMNLQIQQKLSGESCNLDQKVFKLKKQI